MTSPRRPARPGQAAREGAAFLVGLLVAAGSLACQAGEPPTEATETTPTSPSTVPDYTVPAVHDPLDLSRYVERPCTILTAKQIEQLHVPSSAKPDYGDCTWKESDNHLFWVVVRPAIGLAKIYRSLESQSESIDGAWEPTTVAGYPAAYSGYGRQDRCAIEVGVSDTQSFRIDDSGAGDRAAAVSPAERQDPCARTRVAAELIIQNLRDGAR